MCGRPLLGDRFVWGGKALLPAAKNRDLEADALEIRLFATRIDASPRLR